MNDTMASLLEQWLNKKILVADKEHFKIFKDNKPFQHLEITNFFQAEKIADILEALTKEEFYEKNADLFSFKQTQDFITTKEKTLQEIRAMLTSTEFTKYMEAITGLQLKEETIDLHATLYEDTDYLLCHDDKLEGRAIAFIVYLSDLEENDGGSLNLFAAREQKPTNVIKRIIPKINSFVFFHVTPTSFHEVSEMLVDKQRIALGGWFHGR